MYCSDTDCSSIPNTLCDTDACSCVSCPVLQQCGSICCADGEKCDDPITGTCVSTCDSSYQFECESTDGSTSTCCANTPQQYCAGATGECCDVATCPFDDGSGNGVEEYCCDYTYQDCDPIYGCCVN